ncbi:histidine kinase [Pseudoalteromonas sp. S1727]|uniref:DUF4118 domain-containing protein n=1 Tax=Pseudoalteromonas sp. S1727 TaxID=2066514 RepID=UPI001109E6F4|nr:DUF4118 domain-containing protein [Pseudoalteromonas sp. S1727]TMN71695.1 histidine kinase [Pseudoalteromonas sp. S1727]
MKIKQYLSAIAASVLMPILIVLAIFPVRDWFTTTDIVMLQLVWVTLVALRSNRRVAAITTLVSVACTDWFFVTPYFTFHIENIEYVVTFAVMLIVGLVISQLAGQLTSKINDIKQHASNTSCLYELAKGLNGLDEIDSQRGYFQTTVEHHLHITLDWWQVIPVKQPQSRCYFVNGEIDSCWGGFTASQSLDEARSAFLNTAISVLYQAHENTKLRQQSAAISVQAELERAKNALLRSLSHDLRTPLATIMGASSMLADENIVLNEEMAVEQARNIFEQSKILNEHFDKVMELSRVNKMGEDLQWQSISLQTLISEAQARRQQLLINFELTTAISEQDSCQGDITLLEIALANMFENASRYGNGHATLSFSYQQDAQQIDYQLRITNQLASSLPSSTDQGVGLGSVICDVVAKFHHGRFTLEINEQQQSASACLAWSKLHD